MIEFEYAAALKRLPEQFFAQLVKKTQHFIQQGHDVINLGQGNPDLPTPDFIVEALQQAATNHKFHKYAPFQGFPFLKEAIADFYQREYGVEVNPQTEVAILSKIGKKTSIFKECEGC